MAGLGAAVHGATLRPGRGLLLGRGLRHAGVRLDHAGVLAGARARLSAVVARHLLLLQGVGILVGRLAWPRLLLLHAARPRHPLPLHGVTARTLLGR